MDKIKKDKMYTFFENEKLINDVLKGIESLIELVGENPKREGLEDTPYRFLNMFTEYGSGYREDPKEHLKTFFQAPSSNVIVVKDIPFESICEHHLVRFHGVVHIAYTPIQYMTGLSKFARLVDGYSRRLQVQERLTYQIGSSITEVLAPESCSVKIEASHTCMTARGAKAHGSKTITYYNEGKEELISFL